METTKKRKAQRQLHVQRQGDLGACRSSHTTLWARLQHSHPLYNFFKKFRHVIAWRTIHIASCTTRSRVILMLMRAKMFLAKGGSRFDTDSVTTNHNPDWLPRRLTTSRIRLSTIRLKTIMPFGSKNQNPTVTYPVCKAALLLSNRNQRNFLPNAKHFLRGYNKQSAKTSTSINRLAGYLDQSPWQVPSSSEKLQFPPQ